MSREISLPADLNPLFHLGGLGFYLFWIVAVTGLYLFIFFETSIMGAWASVELISNEQYYVGSLMRSLHRYASAAMVLVVTAHLAKEFLMKRYQGPRWFSWVSGVPLLWLLFASGIGGYWLVWDERAQYVAQTTATLFDALPIVVEPMAFGLIDNATVSDRFFSLLIFLHVGIPLALLLGMFIHIQRISRSKSLPPKRLALAALASLTVVSLIKPATSMAPADLDRSVQSVDLDWYYMNVYPLIDILGSGPVWGLLLGITIALLLVPLLSRAPEPTIAVVDPDNCNGCGWCFADCPYDAVYMKPHDYKKNHQQSVVIADKCVGCGICAGACPTVTPFKSVNHALSGINLADKSNATILDEIIIDLKKMSSPGRVLLVGCGHGANIDGFAADDVATVSLECTAQLPPSYIDYLCRREGVDTVVLTGCREGDCYHRVGVELQQARLRHEREPHLRFKDVAVNVHELWVGSGGRGAIADKLRQLRQSDKGGQSEPSDQTRKARRAAKGVTDEAS